MQNRKEHFGKLRLIYDGRRNSVALHGFDPKPAKICWIWQCFTWSFWLPLSPEVKATFGIWTKAKEKVWMNRMYHNSQVSHNSNYHNGFPSFFVSLHFFPELLFYFWILMDRSLYTQWKSFYCMCIRGWKMRAQRFCLSFLYYSRIWTKRLLIPSEMMRCLHVHFGNILFCLSGGSDNVSYLAFLVCFRIWNDIIKTSKTLNSLRKGYSLASFYHLLTSIS